MNTANLCPQCGKPLPSDGPQGQCPACLLKAALPGQSAASSSATALDASAPSSAEAGSRLKYFGDYELLEEIARGGMGVVWKARQTNLNRDVALKMIRAGALAGPEEVQRFLREAEAAANLQHPNIVAIHEVGEHAGQHYFSMDYVAGRDLGALVKDGPLPPQRAARYVKISAEAIQFAHQRGILHRDLKPKNVLIDEADQPRITDFGLAKLMKNDSGLTQSGVVMGSPSYMPPEQAAGRHADVGPASDVYSLGAMLYELLTGRPPFRGATPLATMHDVLENEPAAPRHLKADIPLDLETICLKCLEKSPSARYPTARALAEELERFLQGEPIQARPAGPVRKVVSWARRHPGTLAGLAALVMVVLAFGVVYLVEENAFLQAKIDNPALERKGPGMVVVSESPIVFRFSRGPFHESMQQWNLINSGIVVVGFFVVLFHVALATRGLRNKSFQELKEQWQQAQRIRRTQPLGEPMRTLAIAFALVLIGGGIMFLVTAIRAHVWEGGSLLSWSVTFGTYVPIYFGFAAFGRVIRDYRMVHYGIPAAESQQLTQEQIASIRAVIEENWDLQAACKLYEEALPDAGLVEASEYVEGVAESLRAEQPDKFAYPPLTPANVNWNAMLISVSIQAVVLGVVWFITPPNYPDAAVAIFAYSFLFGAALQPLSRMSGMWKRLLLAVPLLLLVVGSEAILRSTAEDSWRTVWPYVLGFFAGAVATFSGLAGEADRAMRKKLGSK